MRFWLAGTVNRLNVEHPTSNVEYGPGRWRKLKGIAKVRLQSGKTCHAEVHWYEAHGIGRKKMKIKHLLD